MTTIHVLGSGSAKPSAARSNASYLVESATGLSLIDCSGSPAHEIMRRGLDLAGLRRVHLTHGHADHVYGLPSLIHSAWMLGLFRDRPLRVRGTGEAIGVARALLAPFTLEERRNAVRIDWSPVDAVVACEFGDSDAPFVRSLPVSHAGTEAVGYRVGDTVFSGDAVCDERLAAAVDDSVRAFVVDCGGGVAGTAGHAGAKDIAELVRRRPNLETVHLTHIGFAQREEERVLREFSGCDVQVRILADGERFELR